MKIIFLLIFFVSLYASHIKMSGDCVVSAGSTHYYTTDDDITYKIIFAKDTTTSTGYTDNKFLPIGHSQLFDSPYVECVDLSVNSNPYYPAYKYSEQQSLISSITKVPTPTCIPLPRPKKPFIVLKQFSCQSKCFAYKKSLSNKSYQQSICWFNSCSSKTCKATTLYVQPWGGKGKCPQGTMYDPNALNSADGACIPTPSCDTGMTYDTSTNSCIPFSTCENIQDNYLADAKKDCISKGTSLDFFHNPKMD